MGDASKRASKSSAASRSAAAVAARLAADEQRIMLRATSTDDLSAPHHQRASSHRLDVQRNSDGTKRKCSSPDASGDSSDGRRASAASSSWSSNKRGSSSTELSSDDDATSIASKLSRIVSEQEHKLTRTSTASSALSDELYDRSATLLATSGGRAQQDNSLLRVPLCNPPQIHVIGAPDEPTERRAAARDAAAAEGLRRSGSSSNFLPERGDLRQLGDSRAAARAAAAAAADAIDDNNQMRARSNTFGSANELLISRQRQQQNKQAEQAPVLNIYRSAWTLSEFERAFHKSSLDAVDDSRDASVHCSADENHTHNPKSNGQLSSATVNAQPASKPARGPRALRPHNGPVKIGYYANDAHKMRQMPSCSREDLAAPSMYLSSGVRRLSEHEAVVFAPDMPVRRLSHCHSLNSRASSMDDVASIATSTGVSTSNLSKKTKQTSLSVTNRAKSDTTEQRAHSDRGDEGGGAGSDQSNGCCCAAHFGKGSCLWLTARRAGKFVPVIDWLPRYELGWLWRDTVAGLAVAVLNISTSLSAAIVAETDLGAAFRASIINTFVYAVLCSSRHASFGSWSIMSQMLLVSVQRALSDEIILKRLNLGPTAEWSTEEYESWHMNIIIMYTFLIGLIQITAGLLNLGNIVSSFIPEALCSSMIAATAFTMAVGQLANMCGTSNKILWSIERNTTELWADIKGAPVDITDLFDDTFRWVQQIALLVKYTERINLVCVLISIACVLLLAVNQYVLQVQLKRALKRNILIPSEMILLVLMIALSYTLDLRERYHVPTSSAIEIDFVIPDVPNLRLIRELWYDALATALISYTMVCVMARTYGNKFNYEVDCNQELIACGAGNLVGGLFDALPATASFSRTAGQVEAGGKTQMASLINCVVLVALAKLLGGHVAYLPVCVMSATLFYGFVKMMSRCTEALMYWRVCKVDFAIWIVTFVSILAMDIVEGFIYGFLFSILTMLYRAQNRRCYMLGTVGTSDVYVPLVKYPLAQEIESIKIFQFCGPINYACAEMFERLLRHKTRVNVKHIINRAERASRQQAQTKMSDISSYLSSADPRELNLPSHIILDFAMISYIDSAGLHVIKKTIEDYKRINVTIFFASLASHVASVVKSDASLWNVYKERFYITLADAVHCAMRDNRRRRRNQIMVTTVAPVPAGHGAKVC